MKRAFMLLLTVVFLFSACSWFQSKTQKGAIVGTTIGAVTGAVAGQAIGRDTEGTLIGAAVGAAVGGLAGAGVGRYMDLQEKALQEALAQSEMAAVEREGNILAVTLKGDVLFDYDSAVIKPGLYNEIKRIASVMVHYPDTRISVEGHTDSTGTEAYNMELSKRRAEGVANLLVQHGVDKSRIQTIGYGESQPRATNATEAGRQLNRRVEIRIIPLK